MRFAGLAASTKGIASGPRKVTRMALTAVVFKERRLAMKRQAMADKDQIRAGRYAVIMHSGGAWEGRKCMLTRKGGHCNGRLGIRASARRRGRIFQAILRLQRRWPATLPICSPWSARRQSNQKNRILHLVEHSEFIFLYAVEKKQPATGFCIGNSKICENFR